MIKIKVDLTQTHDVNGAFKQNDYEDVRLKFNDAGTKYAFDVLTGVIVAGYMIKLAAFRHLQDLRRSEDDRTFNYHYDLKKANMILGFAKVFPDVDTGEPMPLMPWEKFALTQMVGWRDLQNNRRFTNVIFSVARGQGKTYLMAILSTFDFMIETMNLSNQDFLISSINYKQTGKLYGYIATSMKKIIQQEPFSTIANDVGLVIHKNDLIEMINNNNRLMAISHEGGQYDSFHYKTAIFDEIGEIKSREKISKITSGQVKVPNKQFIQISTSYPDPTVPFHADQKNGQQIMEQDWNRENDDNLIMVWSQDSLEETFEPDSWIKSNPLLGLKSQHAVLMKGLLDERNTKMLQGDLPAFQTKNMNMWLAQDVNSFLNLDDVERAIIPEFDVQNKRVYVGVDYSMMSDNTAIAFVYPYQDESGKQKWHVEQHSFIPWQKAGSIEAKEKQDGINYRELARQGFATITSHPQGLINDDEVYEWIVNYIQDNNLDVIFFGYDAMGMTNVLKSLDLNTGYPLEPIRQRTSELKDPTKFLQTIFVESSITRLDDKIMEKALLNAVLREDSIGIQVDKRQATLKIDVVDAIIDAFYQGMYHFEDFGIANDKSWQVDHMTQEQVKEWFENQESGLNDEI